MKKIIFALMAMSSIVLADTNIEFCEKLKNTQEPIMKIGMDAYSIENNKIVSSCEEISPQEWGKISLSSDTYSLLVGLYIGLTHQTSGNGIDNACGLLAYEVAVANARISIHNKTSAISTESIKPSIENTLRSCRETVIKNLIETIPEN